MNNKTLAHKEIGCIAIKEYTHIIPKTFYCVQRGKRHNTETNMHYYNSLCHNWSTKRL